MSGPSFKKANLWDKVGVKLPEPGSALTISLQRPVAEIAKSLEAVRVELAGMGWLAQTPTAYSLLYSYQSQTPGEREKAAVQIAQAAVDGRSGAQAAGEVSEIDPTALVKVEAAEELFDDLFDTSMMPAQVVEEPAPSVEEPTAGSGGFRRPTSDDDVGLLRVTDPRKHDTGQALEAFANGGMVDRLSANVIALEKLESQGDLLGTAKLESRLRMVRYILETGVEPTHARISRELVRRERVFAHGREVAAAHAEVKEIEQAAVRAKREYDEALRQLSISQGHSRVSIVHNMLEILGQARTKLENELQAIHLHRVKNDDPVKNDQDIRFQKINENLKKIDEAMRTIQKVNISHEMVSSVIGRLSEDSDMSIRFPRQVVAQLALLQAQARVTAEDLRVAWLNKVAALRLLMRAARHRLAEVESAHTPTRADRDLTFFSDAELADFNMMMEIPVDDLTTRLAEEQAQLEAVLPRLAEGQRTEDSSGALAQQKAAALARLNDAIENHARKLHSLYFAFFRDLHERADVVMDGELAEPAVVQGLLSLPHPQTLGEVLDQITLMQAIFADNSNYQLLLLEYDFAYHRFHTEGTHSDGTIVALHRGIILDEVQLGLAQATFASWRALPIGVQAEMRRLPAPSTSLKMLVYGVTADSETAVHGVLPAAVQDQLRAIGNDAAKQKKLEEK